CSRSRSFRLFLARSSMTSLAFRFSSLSGSSFALRAALASALVCFFFFHWFCFPSQRLLLVPQKQNEGAQYGKESRGDAMSPIMCGEQRVVGEDGGPCGCIIPYCLRRSTSWR